MKTYRLTKTELKNGKFLYEVKDENNTTISKRTSTRGHYIACTIDGQFYFGRRDLIGKGMHGQLLNQAIVAKSYSVEQWRRIAKHTAGNSTSASPLNEAFSDSLTAMPSGLRSTLRIASSHLKDASP